MISRNAGCKLSGFLGAGRRIADPEIKKQTRGFIDDVFFDVLFCI